MSDDNGRHTFEGTDGQIPAEPDDDVLDAYERGRAEMILDTPAGLREYLIRSGATWLADNWSGNRYMAASIASVPVVELPEGFSIREIDPADTAAVGEYASLVRQSLRALSAHPTIANEGATTHRFYIGVYSAHPGDVAVAACTLCVADYQKQGRVARLYDVSTAPEYRRQHLSAALISSVLHRDFNDYQVAFLTSTSMGRPLYEWLGFVTVNQSEPLE